MHVDDALNLMLMPGQLFGKGQQRIVQGDDRRAGFSEIGRHRLSGRCSALWAAIRAVDQPLPADKTAEAAPLQPATIHSRSFMLDVQGSLF